MAHSAAYPCRYAGCSTLLRTSGYCRTHAKALAQRYQGERIGYGPNWSAIRKQVLTEEPTCRACKSAPSTDCDHIQPRSKGGSNQRSNLQGLCHRCHVSKTKAQMGHTSTIYKASQGQEET